MSNIITLLEQAIKSTQEAIASYKSDTKTSSSPEITPPIVKGQSKWVVYVDAGHGGNHPQTGAYMTRPQDGKQYTFMPEGINIREGVVNRLIADTFCEMLSRAGIEFVKCYHEYLDSSHDSRVGIANKHYEGVEKQGRKGFFLSFHSNAFGMSAVGKSLNPQGFSVWTTRGNTDADKIADMWYKEHQDLHGNRITYRSDKTDADLDYEANFDVLFFSHMPAVLVENLFFTNLEDAKKLLDPLYQTSSARAAYNMVVKLEKNG